MTRQLQIGNVTPENPLILAPLAGYSDLPFRLLCRQFGAGLCYTEMVSCHGLVYQKDKTLRLTGSCQDERPVALQIFGADPEMMGQAAAIVSEMDVDIIDINMGCPVKKVTKKGAGAALMKSPEIAAKIINSVRKNCSLPLTVKFRTGWNHDDLNAIEFAKMAEDNGASAITIHGRTWSQGFGGEVDWLTIRQVKNNVSIPVIGNGNIESYQDALQAMASSGCDGIMIGRAALGNPWVFSPEGSPASVSRRIQGLQLHMSFIRKFQDAERILPRIKNHAGRYFKGIAGGAVIRQKIYSAKTFPELVELLNLLEYAPPDC